MDTALKQLKRRVESSSAERPSVRRAEQQGSTHGRGDRIGARGGRAAGRHGARDGRRVGGRGGTARTARAPAPPMTDSGTLGDTLAGMVGQLTGAPGAPGLATRARPGGAPPTAGRPAAWSAACARSAGLIASLRDPSPSRRPRLATGAGDFAMRGGEPDAGLSVGDRPARRPAPAARPAREPPPRSGRGRPPRPGRRRAVAGTADDRGPGRVTVGRATRPPRAGRRRRRAAGGGRGRARPAQAGERGAGTARGRRAEAVGDLAAAPRRRGRPRISGGAPRPRPRRVRGRRRGARRSAGRRGRRPGVPATSGRRATDVGGDAGARTRGRSARRGGSWQGSTGRAAAPEDRGGRWRATTPATATRSEATAEGTGSVTLTIGVDVGGTKVAGGVVDEHGTVLASNRRDTPAEDHAGTRDTIVEVAAELAAPSPGGHRDRHRRGGLDRRGRLDRAVRAQPGLAGRAAARLRDQGRRPAHRAGERRQRGRLGGVPVRRGPAGRRLDGDDHRGHRHRRRHRAERLALARRQRHRRRAGAHPVACRTATRADAGGSAAWSSTPAATPWSGSPGPARARSRNGPRCCSTWPAATRWRSPAGRSPRPRSTATGWPGTRSRRSATGWAWRWPTWRRSSTRRCWWSAAA